MHLKTRNVNTAFRELVQFFKDGQDDKTETFFRGHNPIVKRPSRQGNVLVIDEPVTITYTHPRERVLFNQARDVNPFFLLYEQLWMLAGRNDVAPLAYYNSKIAEIASDDGKTFNGAYGYRWRNPQYINMKGEKPRDQLDLLVNHLKADPNSRRAVLQMWNVEDDLLKIGGNEVEVVCPKCNFKGSSCTECCNGMVAGVDKGSKDVCCNLSVMFSIRCVSVDGPEGQTDDTLYLDITVTNRSNDLVWGLLGSDYVTFTILQEYMAARLGCEVGMYHHFTSNLHVYDWNWFPEKWLVDKYVDGENAYRCIVSGIDPFPLVKDPAVFEKELPLFVGAFNGEEEPRVCVPHWEEPFFEQVAAPMLQAFRYHKTNNPICALEECKFIKADDWRIVATNWLTKRSKK